MGAIAIFIDFLRHNITYFFKDSYSLAAILSTYVCHQAAKIFWTKKQLWYPVPFSGNS